jgi:carbon-monoxide dehydrogenase medium subunit
MGVAETPLRLREAERALRGVEGTPASAEKFAEIVRASVSPNSDIHVSADYRRSLVGALAQRAFTTAWNRAAGDAA